MMRKWKIAAFVWGFAEATLFFTVPDVLLTFAAVKLGGRKALRLVVYVLSGALLGGAAMYGLGALNADTARATVNSVPLISPEMLARAGDEMRENWLWNMLIGAVTGTPYKVYAIEAPGAGVSFGTFLIGSAIVRPIRWVMTLGFAVLIVKLLQRAGQERIAMPLWAVMWISFYAYYYVLMRS